MFDQLVQGLGKSLFNESKGALGTLISINKLLLGNSSSVQSTEYLEWVEKRSRFHRYDSVL